MKKQKTPKAEKGKTNKDKSKYGELQRNILHSETPEMDTTKDLLKSPTPPKEPPIEKDTPKINNQLEDAYV